MNNFFSAGKINESLGLESVTHEEEEEAAAAQQNSAGKAA